jgi:large-conductance mechanosensitive channel
MGTEQQVIELPTFFSRATWLGFLNVVLPILLVAIALVVVLKLIEMRLKKTKKEEPPKAAEQSPPSPPPASVEQSGNGSIKKP